MRLEIVGSNPSALIAATLTFCLSFLGGCTTGQAGNLDNWAADSSDRCEALSVSYAVVGPTLQSILGPNFVPQLDPSTGRGTLTIEMYGCRSAPLVTRLHGPYQAGRVLIALDGSRTPIAVAGTDRWDSYVLHIGGDDEPLTRFMKTNDVATFVIDIAINRSTLEATGFVSSSATLASRYDSSEEAISGGLGNRRRLMGFEFTGQDSTFFGIEDISGNDVPIFSISGGRLRYNATGDRSTVDWREFNSAGATSVSISAGYRLIIQTEVIGGTTSELGGNIRVVPVLYRGSFLPPIQLNDVEFTNVSGNVRWTKLILRQLTAFKSVVTNTITPKNHDQLEQLLVHHWDDEYIFGLYRTITVVSDGFSLASKVDFSSTPSVNSKDLATQEYVDDAVTNSGGGGNPGTSEPTAERVKTLYESNADTNAFTNSEKSKLGNIENNATADQTALEIAALLNNSANANNQKVDYNRLANRLTGANIVTLLQALSGEARLDASAVKNLPTGGGGGADTGATRRATETGFTIGSHVGVSGQAQTSQRLITLPSGKTLSDYDRITVRITWPTSGSSINNTGISTFYLPELIALTENEWDAISVPGVARGASLFHLEINPSNMSGTSTSFNIRLRDANTAAPVQMSTAVIEEVIGVSG